MTVHTTRTTLIIATSAIALGLAGCATPGTPDPTPGQETSTAAHDPFHIEKPKNLAAVSDPCQLLNQDQIQQLSAGSPDPGKSEWGEGQCTWENQQLRITVAPDTVQNVGLEYTAKVWGSDGKPSGQVSGYPLIHGGISEIFCTATVGVSEKQTLTAHFTVGSDGRGKPEYADPCAMADKIAGLVLENVPPA